MNQCPNCGTKLEAHMAFCAGCGNSLEALPLSGESSGNVKSVLKKKILIISLLVSVVMITAGFIVFIITGLPINRQNVDERYTMSIYDRQQIRT